jgi:hypothetical protein
MKKLINFGGVVICLGLMLSAANVHGQNYDSPGLGERPVASHPQDFKPLGVRAGAFMLHPGVQLAAQWTDNAFYANTDLRSDTIYHVRPYISAQSTWSRHSLNVSLAADIAFYNKYSERNYEDYFFGINGRVDVKNRSFFTYSLDYMNLHEGLNNRTSEQGIEPTRYDLYGGRLAYDHTFNRVSLAATIGWNRFDFDDVIKVDGEVIDNDDRDRETTSYTFKAAYQIRSDKQVFVRFNGYDTKYDQQFDRNGYDRTGSGYSIDGGISFSVTGRLNGDVFATYYNRDFDDPRLESNSGWLLAGGAGLEWNPTALTSVYGRIASSVQDTTDANSSSYVNTMLSLRVDHELRRDLQLNGFLAYSINDYDSIDLTAENLRTEDNIFRAGLGLNWFINRHLYLNASYSYETLASSLLNDDYATNNIWLVLGLEY